MSKKEKTAYPLAKRSAVVAVREAKATFSALVERAALGEEIVISWHGRPRARLLPLAEPGGALRVDRNWLRSMTVHRPQALAEDLVRADRDGRG